MNLPYGSAYGIHIAGNINNLYDDDAHEFNEDDLAEFSPANRFLWPGISMTTSM